MKLQELLSDISDLIQDYKRECKEEIQCIIFADVVDEQGRIRKFYRHEQHTFINYDNGRFPVISQPEIGKDLHD